MIANKLKELRRERGITLEELAAKIGTTKQTIHRYENGIIANIPHERIEELAAALAVAPSELMGWSDNSTPDNATGRVRRLPLLGRIACGEPIFAAEEHGEYLPVAGVDADFCLTARGDSMIGARIYDGDIVFIRSQDMVDDGEIAAVIIGEEATLKRVYYSAEDEKLILSPENPRYAPMVFVGKELENVKILGKAVAFQSVI